MNESSRGWRAAVAVALLSTAMGAKAQSAPWVAYGYARPQFFLGGSIGASFFADSSGTTTGWLNSAYTSSTPLASGDYIVSAGSQDSTSFGAKVYGGAWITRNIGLELGYTYLGSINWRVDSVNTTGSFNVSDWGTVEPWALYEALLLAGNSGGIRFYGKLGAYEANSNFEATSLDNNSGGSFGASQTIHNSGALLGLGLTAPAGYGGAWRIEVEDYLNVGETSSTQIPPWRGNIVLLSAGYTFLF